MKAKRRRKLAGYIRRNRVVCPARAGKRENRNERRERTRERGLNLERRGRFSGDAP